MKSSSVRASTKSTTDSSTKLRAELHQVTAKKYQALRHNKLPTFLKLWRREMDIKKRLKANG